MSAAKKTNGAALRAIRKSRGMKLRHLSERLFDQGAAAAKVPHLSLVERGRRDASDELRNAIANVLGVPVTAIERSVPSDSAA